MSDGETIYVPGYLDNDDTSDSVYIPSFLSEDIDEYGVSPAASCTAYSMPCNQGDCTTECSEYGMGSCGESCVECGQPCNETTPPVCTPYSMPCNQGDCSTQCSEYCMGTMEGWDCINGEGGDCVNGEGGDCVNGEGGSDEEGELTEGAILSLTSTKNSITIRFAPIAGAVMYKIYYRTTNGSAITVNVTTTTYTITGLESDTAYVVNYRGIASDSTLGPLLTTSEESRTIETKNSDEWSWWSPIASGLPINISAAEWNDFCSFINDVRADNNLSAYSFTTVSRGTLIRAFLVNQARTAISGISRHGTLPAEMKVGYTITAQYFIDLANAVNAAL